MPTWTKLYTLDKADFQDIVGDPELLGVMRQIAEAREGPLLGSERGGEGHWDGGNGDMTDRGRGHRQRGLIQDKTKM